MTLTLTAPTSKSMTQRALLIAALSPNDTHIERPLMCDDSEHLSTVLRTLGCTVTWSSSSVEVSPGPLSAQGETIFCGNAGTAVRFSSCLSLLCEGPLTIDGNEHMRKRPIGPLGDSLEQLGVQVRYLANAGCPPLRLERRGDIPQVANIDTSLSSQYASGLLMVAPCLSKGLTVKLTGELVSRPYLQMTVAMMQQAGAQVNWTDERTIVVKPGGYVASDSESTATKAQRIAIETDWSGAAFLLAAGQLTNIVIVLPGLPTPEHSLQGDAVFSQMLESIDQNEINTFDLSDAPDLIAPLTARCLFAERPTRIRGAAHTRIKECDRVHVLCRELRKVGAQMQEHDDGLDIEPLKTPLLEEVTLDPEQDHRMAMTFGIASLRLPNIKVSDPDCVTKSFPNFWPVLEQLRQQMPENKGMTP